MIILSAWLPVVLWAGVIFWLSAIPGLKSPWDPWDFFLRKCAHVTEFAILMALLMRAFILTSTRLRAKEIVRWSAAVAILYAISDEVHQMFVPHRGPAVTDVLIDCCGVLLVLLIYRRTRIFQKIKFPELPL